MPFIFTDTVASDTTLATNSSVNTETNQYSLKAASSRGAAIQAIYVIGRGAGLTSISGIAFRTRYYSTASTGGATSAIAPKDEGMGPTANHTSVFATTAITAGTPGSKPNQVIFGCGAAGPGGWIAPNPDSVIALSAGTTASMDLITASGTASLNFELSIEVIE